jgi:hypothetical protein
MIKFSIEFQELRLFGLQKKIMLSLFLEKNIVHLEKYLLNNLRIIELQNFILSIGVIDSD